MDKKLPARPNLDHLRGQAKTLARTANTKLSEAQFEIAKQNGFSSWPALTKHIDTLRSFEGEWHIARLEVNGAPTPREMLARTKILIDGDRFRTESPEGTYEGIFAIDTSATPPHFDLQFVAGPDAGNTVLGIYRLDGPDDLILCLGLVGARRPSELVTRDDDARDGNGRALEHLRRTSTARPEHVTGGTPEPVDEDTGEAAAAGDVGTFEQADTPLLRSLQGAWEALELVNDGKPLPTEWLPMGERTMTGNDVAVVFGGQRTLHARVRIDESRTPIAIDYLHLDGKNRDKVSAGILDWRDDEVWFVIAAPGKPRPSAFEHPARGTFSRWRKRPPR